MDPNMRNRIYNSGNHAQGLWPRTLCVCSAGLLRSPTLAYVLTLPPYNRNTRAAGSVAAFALIPVDEALLSWAHEVVFVNRQNHDDVKAKYDIRGNTFVLDVPDHFCYRDWKLIDAITKELTKVQFPSWNPDTAKYEIHTATAK